MTCKKTQGFLESNGVTVKATADATKEKKGREEALALVKDVSKVVAAKGKSVVSFDMKKDPPDEETLLSHLLGPTGNLRAPTMLKGKTLLVGFNEEIYAKTFGVE